MALDIGHHRIANVPLLEEALDYDKVKADIVACPKTKILLLPSLYREFDRPKRTGERAGEFSQAASNENGFEPSAMDKILPTLKELTFIDHIVIGLDAADKDQYKEVQQILLEAGLPQNVYVIWNNHPEIEAWRNDLAADGLGISKPGKGRNVHTMMGFANAILHQSRIAPEDAIVAIHDCDIVTYSPMLVARLFQPMSIAQGADVEYVKGHYSRYDEKKLHGRVTRLGGPALIDSVANLLQNEEGYNDRGLREKLQFMRSFKYMFAGEMTFSGGLMNKIEMPNDYSMETTILEQVYSITSKHGSKVADVELTHRYDHHHQDDAGVEEMFTQITSAVINIANEHVDIHDYFASDEAVQEFVGKVQKAYTGRATNIGDSFSLAAAMHHIPMDTQKEQNTVGLFRQTIPEAFRRVKEGEVDKPAASWDDIVEIRGNAVLDDLYLPVYKSGGLFLKDEPHRPLDSRAEAKKVQKLG